MNVRRLARLAAVSVVMTLASPAAMAQDPDRVTMTLREFLQLYEASKDRLVRHLDQIMRMARLETALAGDEPSGEGVVRIVHDEATVMLPLAEVIDISQERDRLSREVEKMTGEIGKIEKKLANEQFVAKAPAHVIEEQKSRRQDALETRDRLADALSRL